MNQWLEEFKKDGITRELFYETNGQVLKIRAGFLYDGRRKRGYQLTINNDTEHQQYLKTISEYNKNLREELAKKDRLIAESVSGTK